MFGIQSVFFLITVYSDVYETDIMFIFSDCTCYLQLNAFVFLSFIISLKKNDTGNLWQDVVSPLNLPL